MKELNRFLTRSLRWISFEAISYQLVLLIYQLALFNVVDHAFYGLIGASFSVVYLLVTIADLGLESSLSPFFNRIQEDGSLFRRFLVVQLMPTVCCAFLLSIGVFFLGFLPLFSSLTSVMLFVLLLLVVLEAIKKSLRTAMHLAFLNKEVAAIEVFSVLLYVASIWLCYFSGFTINFLIVFGFMLVSSFVATVFMSLLLIMHSLTLPSQGGVPNVCYKRVLRCRSFSFFNQLSHTFFSSNFLVPFFALQFGFVQAGVFKVISHVVYSVTSIVRKTFGLASDALLAKAKNMNVLVKKELFSAITQQLFHVFYGIVIFLFINHNKIFLNGFAFSNALDIRLIYLFIFICLSENLFITYEKLFIIEEKVATLLVFNLFVMGIIYGVVKLCSACSPFVLLLAIIIVRVCMFVILSLLSFHLWKIKPRLKLKPSYIMTALVVSLGFFIFL